MKAIADRPAELVEPSPDRIEEQIGKDMHMGIHHSRQMIGDPIALGVV